jgi:hypothetical protein
MLWDGKDGEAMSGGSYDYAYARVQDMAGRLMSANETPLRRAFGEHLRLVADAMQTVEWVDSCDFHLGDEDEPIRKCIAPGAEADAAREALLFAMKQAEKVLERMVRSSSPPPVPEP